jgi:anaerobic ribonucleoside-triphosphate reductase activating protein
VIDLRVAQVIERTEAEGPGDRFAVWVQGCTIRCKGCCNPEMFERDGGTIVAPEDLAERAARANVEGITLLGGEPFEQAEACARLAEAARAKGLSVMIFTGYTRAELDARAREPGVRELLASCDLLVDGRFQGELLDTSRRWIGSKNQTMHFLTSRYAPDDPRMGDKQTIEIRLTKDDLVVNGWPKHAQKLISLRRAPS